LNRLIAMVDSRDHVLLRVFDPILLWTVQLAFALEAWRRKSGPAIRRWLAAVGELEALSALAGYAYEHPADPFPEFVEGAAYFDGRAVAHPLLPEDRAVRNDVHIGGELRLMVVSGSNMSGKSTLLRAVGVNAVLAQCGAPVRAAHLRMSRLAVGASIQIMDSLQDGKSRFYTEITRLKQIVDLTREHLPVLFLLDEFLQGTNSHDRRIGAEAIVRGLLRRDAIGLLTTHDLALTEIAEALGKKATNQHFEDRLENGTLVFDYRLRPGVVQRSNALELMRSVGLDV
jgi:DNA mismatch repair ATPase MutS